jgi:dimethylargininase
MTIAARRPAVPGLSCRFDRALTRLPAASVVRGLRAGDGGDPDQALFERQHESYRAALVAAGVAVEVLPPLEAFPDSVFLEDAALCLPGLAVALRPGAPSRRGEAAALRPRLEALFETVLDLPDTANLDGGDILTTDREILVGLSARSDAAGAEALAAALAPHGYRVRRVATPAGVLHLKSDCATLGGNAVLATPRLAAAGCFAGYEVIETAPGEEAAANAIRVNDRVFVAAGFPGTAGRLAEAGYDLVPLDLSEAAKLDGGLSCLSLRFAA